MTDAPRDQRESSTRASSFLGHTATYAVGNIARRLVGFLMLPIYTRYLTPADYGVIGLITFAIAVFEPIFGARLGRAIPKFYLETSDSRIRRTVIWGAMCLTGVVSAITVIGVIMFRNAGAEFLFGNKKYAFALALFAVGLFTQPIEDTGMAYLRLQQRSRLFVGFSLVKLAVQLGLNLLLVVHLHREVVGVAESSLIASAVMAIAVLAYVIAYERPAFDWPIVRRMWRFCWPLWVSSFAGLYIASSGAVFLRFFDGLSDVGRLQLALKLASTVGMLLWAPFSQHWEPMSFRYYYAANLDRKFQVAFSAVAAVMVIGGLGVSVFAEPAIRLMATPPFYAAAALVPMLVLGFVLNRLSTFFNFSFIVTGHTKAHGVCQYATAGVITLAYWALVPRYGLIGSAYAQLIGFATGFGIARIVSRRYFDPGIRVAPFAVLVGIAAIACIATAAVGSPRSIVMDLAIRSLAWGVASLLIGRVALRSITALDAEVLAGLPAPLVWITRLAAGRVPTRC